MPTPELSPFQSAVLSSLVPGKMSGRELRERLRRRRIHKDGPAFYQSMARMEDGKWVEGWYEQVEIEGQVLKDRWYRILGHGARVLNSAQLHCQGKPTVEMARYA